MTHTRTFAVFDIDGTIFRSSLVIELMKAGINKGVFPAETIHEYQDYFEAWRKRKDKHAYNDYIDALVKSYSTHLKGVSRKKLELLAETVVDEQSAYTYVYPRQLIRELKAQGYFLIAISGSPRELVSRFTQIYGFDTFAATEYHMVEDVYTGESTHAHSNKDTILRRMVTQHNLVYSQSVAVGDTKGDITLLENVERPIAFNPDMELFDAAQTHEWEVVIERKNMVYHLEPTHGTYTLRDYPDDI